MSAFVRYIGIDYSGAETPTSRLKGLRVYSGDCERLPEEVLPLTGPRRYWTRCGVAEWLVLRLQHATPTLVGIEHGSFPLRYFEAHQLPPDWPAFLDDFQRHWPTDEDHLYVDFVRDGLDGNGAARAGSARWRRLTEQRAGSAKPVFHFLTCPAPSPSLATPEFGLRRCRPSRDSAGDRQGVQSSLTVRLPGWGMWFLPR